MAPMDDLAEQFEQNRTHLRAVAYRMLGSVTEADDAVQEAWLRLSRSDAESVSNLRGWLTTVVGRVCLDMLRTRRARREELAGQWTPEPVVSTLDTDGDPEHEALLADSVAIALLVVLETLTPAERLAFVLHDMFAVPFEDIAPVVGRNAAATRQLASRARRRVRGGLPVTEPDVERQREVVDAFLAASRCGDFEALVAVLDPDVVFRADSPRAGETPIRGAAAVAQRVLERGSRFAAFGRPVLVGGAAGVVVAPAGRPIAIAAFTVVEGRIAAIDVFVDPDRIRRLV